MGPDHSNMVFARQVLKIHPSASTTPTPHLPTPLHVPNTLQHATTKLRIAGTCCFLSRVGMSLEIHFDYSNTAVICRVAEISLPASTTTTPHLHSSTSTLSCLSRRTPTQLLIGWTCLFLRRAPPTLYMGLDHTNMAIINMRGPFPRFSVWLGMCKMQSCLLITPGTTNPSTIISRHCTFLDPAGS